MRKNFIFICALFLVVSCTSDRDTSSKLRVMLLKQDYKSAEDFAMSNDFYDEKRNVLLKELERGNIFYLEGKYKQAFLHLYQAKQISDELYTTSISKKIVATAISTQLDNYYGERYERSLIRFYLSLVNYNLYITGKYEAYKDQNGNKIPEQKLTENERRQHLSVARANVLEWDSLLTSYKNELAGESTYKRDLTQKIWAAYIHKQMGSSNDKQIALQLYKDAKDTLLKNYNLYPTFNDKSDDFDKNYSKLAHLPIAEVQKKYVSPTIFANDLIAFIDKEIAQMESRRDENLVVLVKDGILNKKKAKRVVIGFGISEAALRSREKGDVDIIPIVYPATQLGVLYGDPFLLTLGLTAPTFEFEVPSVPDYVNNAVLTGILSKNGKEVSRFPIVITNPLNDIAQKEINDKFAGQIVKTAGITITKHIAAIIAAKVAYNAMINQKMNPLIALISTMGTYKAATMAINASAEADLRNWSSLPYNIRFGTANVPQGEYDFTIKAHYVRENKDDIFYKHPSKVVIKGEQNFLDLNIGWKEQK
ncbi:MAG: hypothetical protein Ta2D_08360 [Rickettsiales bacterium]|nr:MAG: hypothetical protein Ta2D_08360 [Rickettsiales bacterium]